MSLTLFPEKKKMPVGARGEVIAWNCSLSSR